MRSNNKFFSINGVTIAVRRMEEMLEFYSRVFEIDFIEQQMFNSKLYKGGWDSLDFLLCPAEIAKNTAKQNRHQFELIVEDLDSILEKVKKFGGEVMGEIKETADLRMVSIYDPDKNSMVMSELKVKSL